MSEVHVAFSGPYAWLSGEPTTSVAKAAAAAAPGLYLWTAPSVSGHLVYCVGETARTLAQRLEEHLYEQLSGRYRFYEPTAFLRGEKLPRWRGVYGQGGKPDVSDFVRQLPDLAGDLAAFVRSMRFVIAPTPCPNRERRRIEASPAAHFRSQQGPVGPFQDSGIHYEPRLPDEPPLQVHFTWSERPVGAPDRLET